MLKRGLIFVLAVSFFILSFQIAGAIILHSSVNVSLGIDGINQSVQQIATANFKFPSHTYLSGISVNPGHAADRIWVSVKDGEMSLYQAFSSANKLCPAIPLANYTSSPADKTKPYHFAAEIQFSSGKSLQQAIDDGDFCYTWQTNMTFCNETCGGGFRKVNCTRNNLTQVTNDYCYGTKPSVACNMQQCLWVQYGMSCIPAGCSSFCPFPPLTNTSCPARNSTTNCGQPAGCTQASGECRIFFYRCQ